MLCIKLMCSVALLYFEIFLQQSLLRDDDLWESMEGDEVSI